MNELALFAGSGGGLLGSILLGHHPICAVEIDPYCRRVLLLRQQEGYLSPFPIWDDARTFDGKPWCGRIGIITGGFPCQDISAAGTGKGLAGEKSGLWGHFARIIDEVKPKEVFIENSPYLRTRGLVRVLQDLADMGFDAAWGVVGANQAGAPHIRKRIWILATNPTRIGPWGRGLWTESPNPPWQRTEVVPPEQLPISPEPTHPISHPYCQKLWKQPGREAGTSGPSPLQSRPPHWWPVDCISGVGDGGAYRVDRTRATGNGQVPGVVRLAYRELSKLLYQKG